MSDETERETKRQIAAAKQILSDACITLSVNGCGCCESPWVRLTHHGVDIIYDTQDGDKPGERGYCIIDMHKEGETWV